MALSEGRGWIAAGVLISRGGTGEGSLLRPGRYQLPKFAIIGGSDRSTDLRF